MTFFFFFFIALIEGNGDTRREKERRGSEGEPVVMIPAFVMHIDKEREREREVSSVPDNGHTPMSWSPKVTASDFRQVCKRRAERGEIQGYLAHKKPPPPPRTIIGP